MLFYSYPVKLTEHLGYENTVTSILLAVRLAVKLNKQTDRRGPGVMSRESVILAADLKGLRVVGVGRCGKLIQVSLEIE